MKLPWKNVTVAPAAGPSALPRSAGWPRRRGARLARGEHPFCSRGRGRRGCGGFSFRALLRPQEASPMWRGDAARRQPAPPSLLRTPALTTTGLPRGQAPPPARHGTRLLFSLESPAFGSLHPFLRERQEAEWIRAIYGYLHPGPYRAPSVTPRLDGDAYGWAHALPTAESGTRSIPACSSPPGPAGRDQESWLPQGSGTPHRSPSLASCQHPHRRFPREAKAVLSSWRHLQRAEDRPPDKPTASPPRQRKPESQARRGVCCREDAGGALRGKRASSTEN